MKLNSTLHIIFIWLILVTIGLVSRSYFPIDETRYVTVAWNMWLKHDYLVPYLNDVAYSHKPPMLFWLINLGWAVFGVNDWWPRLVPSLFALATVFLTRQLAARLWPQQHNTSHNTALILLASGLWVIYSTALMFDMLIAFFTVLGILGLIIAYQDRALKGWLLFALAIAGGLLAKGPTILLQLLPVALLASWWGSQERLSIKHWYLPILYAVLAGISIALLWAIPAGIHGGSEYQHAIFWGQTANRMVDSFAHKRPIWWYLMLLPVLLFPWLLWGAFWKGLLKTVRTQNDWGTRFCLAWLLPVLIAFSFISGKQVHYVLPLFPAFALLLARVIENTHSTSRSQVLPITLATIALGLLLVYLPSYLQSHPNSALWIQTLPQWLGWLIVALGLAVFALPKTTQTQTVTQLSVFSVSLIVCLMFVVMKSSNGAYDVRPISKKLYELELQHVPIAYIGTKYPGIFNFLGRLQQSPEIVPQTDIADWFAQHPSGRIIALFKGSAKIDLQQVEFYQTYRGSSKLAILNHQQWLTHQNMQADSAD
ncbi:MAG: glycosyltransferase family 39 protein [Methylophilus sp.]|nr:glycosyltransferase family 39 protein [Methylophilus sp.]